MYTYTYTGIYRHREITIFNFFHNNNIWKERLYIKSALEIISDENCVLLKTRTHNSVMRIWHKFNTILYGVGKPEDFFSCFLFLPSPLPPFSLFLSSFCFFKVSLTYSNSLYMLSSYKSGRSCEILYVFLAFITANRDRHFFKTTRAVSSQKVPIFRWTTKVIDVKN